MLKQTVLKNMNTLRSHWIRLLTTLAMLLAITLPLGVLRVSASLAASNSAQNSAPTIDRVDVIPSSTSILKLQNVTALAAGLYHTCAVTSSGGVKCWGDGTSGQLGNGTWTGVSTPVDASGLTGGVEAVAAGRTHTCAVTTSGGVKCWGSGTSGQLGDSWALNRNIPVNVSGLTIGVMALAAGGSHTCAVTTSGGAKCWGSGYRGELGGGTQTQQNTPADVSGLTSGVRALTAGEYHTCALTTSGGVKCWGENLYGQLGDGTTIDRLTPVDVSGLTSDVTALAAGRGHTCALTTSGGIKCWGGNDAGQLGDGTTIQQNVPTDVSGLTSGVTALTAGYGHTCAVLSGGGVKCWGSNMFGQLGDNTTTNRRTPVEVIGLTSSVAVLTAGESHTCAVTTSGGAKCWGNNSYGKLGDGTTIDRLTPADVAFSTYKIAGRIISESGAGLPNVSISTSAGQAASTDASGYYTISSVLSGTYSITPTQFGYAFMPPSRSISVPPDALGQDFTSIPATNTIAGRITSGSGAALPNVTVLTNAGQQVLTNASGYYTITNLVTGTYTITPALVGYTFAPVTRTALVPPNAIGQDFIGTSTTNANTISGRVINESGAGVPNVTVTTNTSKWAVTNGSGYYTITNVVTGTYTLFAILTGYTFSPSTRAVTVPPNATGQNFTVVSTYTITGRIGDENGAGVPGIQVSALNTATYSASSATTDAAGHYTITNVLSGTYALYCMAPVTPLNRFVSVPPDATGQDFTRVEVYKIVGQITYGNSEALPGVTVSTNTGESGITDASGYYTITGLISGTYAITPSVAGYTFTPAMRSVSLPPDAIGQDFSGSGSGRIRGRVIDAAGVGLPNVTLYAGANNSSVTDANGYFNLTGLVPGQYTITPTLSGYAFSPEHRTVIVPPGSTNSTFVGTLQPVNGHRSIDLSISIYRTVPLQERAAYENILGYFADAIYEMSNGTQTIRRITIYQNGEDSDTANVLWEASLWPCAHAASYGPWGLHVYMADIFAFPYPYSALGISNQRGAGWTFAHEWGHYYYGLYDEYAGDYDGLVMPHATDIPVEDSVMDDPWLAADGEYNWGNFSVSKNTLNGQGKTAQDRVYGASGWETLARPVSQDPRNEGVWLPRRTYFEELAAVAPTVGQDATLELTSVPTTTTRSQLSINWAASAGGVANAHLATTNSAYQVTINALGGQDFAYPRPVVVIANVSAGEVIAKAGITAILTRPDGEMSGLSLHDDGSAPDTLANDGLYSGFMPYDQDGEYVIATTFDNHAGLAVFTQSSAMHAIGPNGETYTDVPQPVGEDFSRTATAHVFVTGVAADDHGNAPSAATVLQPDDVDVAGRIDRPGDVDVFKVTANANGQLVVRVSGLALGMLPKVRILGADGVSVIGVYSFTPQANNYFFARLNARSGETFYVEISHQNNNAVGGLYEISAGAPLTGEKYKLVYLPVIIRH